MRHMLLVLANPRGTDTLRLMAEERAIRECNSTSRRSAPLLLGVLPAATVDDVRRALLYEKYQIVHFSGHGTGLGLAFEDQVGDRHVISAGALSHLLAVHSPPLECVVLNACGTSCLAEGVSSTVPYAIAMSAAISDHAAIEFTRGFYDAIAAGKDYESSFREGSLAIDLAGVPQASIPVLYRSPMLRLLQVLQQMIPASASHGCPGLPAWLKGDLLDVFQDGVRVAAASPTGQLTMRHLLVPLLRLQRGVCADAISRMGYDPVSLAARCSEDFEQDPYPSSRIELTDSVRQLLAELEGIDQGSNQGDWDDSVLLLAALHTDSVAVTELLEDLACDKGELERVLIAAKNGRNHTPRRKRSQR